MQRFLIVVLFSLFCRAGFGYNPHWVLLDKNIITHVIHLDKKNPSAVAAYFKPKCDSTKENLGFGWRRWTPAVGGGYISIHAEFLYYHDSIISYTLFPGMPREKSLTEKYKKWYAPTFAFKSDTILSFKFNEDKIHNGLAEYSGSLSPQTVPYNILDYMTPGSGTMYGYNGREPSLQFPNRRAFYEIMDSLTNDRIVFMMYSINPASRFTAIEYYLNHKEHFNDTAGIDIWVERNFTELPEVKTKFGCIVELYDTRTLVEMFRHAEKKY